VAPLSRSVTTGSTRGLVHREEEDAAKGKRVEEEEEEEEGN